MNYKTVGFIHGFKVYPYENKMRTPALEKDYIYVYEKEIYAIHEPKCMCAHTYMCWCHHILLSSHNRNMDHFGPIIPIFSHHKH